MDEDAVIGISFYNLFPAQAFNFVFLVLLCDFFTK